MDHVSANKALSVTERENISGARVFDGEDQGKYLSSWNLISDLENSKNFDIRPNKKSILDL